MHPGIVGALALIGTAGAIYFGSGYLNDYFAARNADTAVESAAQNDEATGTPSSLVGDADTAAPAADAVADAVEDATQAATQEVAAVADDVADAASDMADTVQETAQETLERVLEASPREESETSDQDAAPEPGTTPVLDIVRIEPTGEAVIAGNAPQGERVGLLYNDELIADSAVDAGGDFVLIPDQPIPSGEGTMEIVVIDEAGNTVVPSQEQVAVVLPEDGSADGFLVGVLRPNEPVEIIERQAPAEVPEVEVAAVVEPSTSPETQAASDTSEDTLAEDTVTEDAVEVPDVEIAARVEPTAPVETEQAVAADAPDAFVVVDAIELEGTDMWIAGGALPGTVVRLYQDNVFLGEVIAGDEGRYLFEGTLLESEGDVTVRADALVPGSADVIARAEVPFEVPLSISDLAVAALEQVEETATDGVEDAQEQAAAAVETTSEALQDVAETVGTQVETASEAATQAAVEVADTVAETVVETAAETVAAVETEVAALVEDVTSNEAADEPVTEAAAVPSDEPAQQPAETETAAAESEANVVDATAQPAQPVQSAQPDQATQPDQAAQNAQSDDASTTQAPEVEIAVTTTPSPAQEPTTPPTEALTRALEEAAAETVEATESSPAQTPAVETAATTETAAATETAATSETDMASAQDSQADSAPAAAPATAPAAETTARPERISVLDTGQVIIRRGDNLWRLSRRVYGQGIRYTSIYDANRDQIGRPELIFPGQVFTLPTPQEEWGAVPGLEALEDDQIPGAGQQ